jgi:hypothetical protein
VGARLGTGWGKQRESGEGQQDHAWCGVDENKSGSWEWGGSRPCMGWKGEQGHAWGGGIGHINSYEFELQKNMLRLAFQ